MKEKIKIIFIPTLLVWISIVVGYTFLHWLLFIKLDLFGLKEIITNFGVPMVLAGLAAWIIIRPRLRLLNLEAKRGNLRDFYCFILWITLMLPAIIAQEYIVTASGALTTLTSVEAIDSTPPSRFYMLKKYYVDKKAIGIHAAFDVSGKHNQYFNMHLYVAMPILERAEDTVKTTCKAWLGEEYSEQISNNLEPSEKENAYREFATKTQAAFDTTNMSRFTYLTRIGNSDKKEGLLEAIKKNASKQGSEIILTPVYKPFAERNGSKVFWIFVSSAIGMTVWLIMLMIPKINSNELARFQEGKPDREALEEMKDVLALLKPREGYYITPILIYVNVGIYLLMVVAGLGFISFKGEDLLTWGANYGPLTKSGEWWRLVTSTFLHGGLLHVLANMYGLLFIGIFLEPVLGRARFLGAYLATGVVGSIASIWWYDATVSVGASGAIFGVYGLFLAFLLMKVFPAEIGKAFLASTIIFIGYNLVMGLAGGIDNAAHIGGLVSGFIIGLILSPRIKTQLADSDMAGGEVEAVEDSL